MYDYTLPGTKSKLSITIEVKSDISIIKNYIYILAIFFGAFLIIGVVILLYVFRSWFERVYCCSCCKSTFARSELPKILSKSPEEHYEPSKNKYNQETCPICLCPFKVEDIIRILECKHIFHGKCIVAWFTREKIACPICKVKSDNRI